MGLTNPMNLVNYGSNLTMNIQKLIEWSDGRPKVRNSQSNHPFIVYNLYQLDVFYK